jgi:hypothetical protein
VLAIADKYRLRPYLDDLLDAVQKLFPECRSITAFVQHDPEERDLEFLVFEVNVPATIDGATLRDRDLSFGEFFFRTVPPPYWTTPVLSFRFDE